MCSRVVRWCNPIMGQRMSHVFLNHLASRHWTHQVLQFVTFDWGSYFPFTYTTCMSLKVRKCINPWELKCVLSSDGSKFLRTMFSTWVHLHIQNVLDYLLALLNNCCPVLLLILKELKQGIGGHLARRLLGVGCKQLVNLRPLQKVVIECNKLVFIQGLKRMEFC